MQRQVEQSQNSLVDFVLIDLHGVTPTYAKSQRPV